jgi:hypothetical protein
LKTFPAEYRSSLRRLEGNGSLFTALRAVRTGLDLVVGVIPTRGWSRSQYSYSLGLATFASLRFVLELFIVEKKLFTGCENKIRATVYAL